MSWEMYSWGGEFRLGDPASPIAVVTLSDAMEFDTEKVAIWGGDKTENLGVEKVVGNILSNPNIRFLLVCGTEVRGHRAGHTLVSLHRNGMDADSRVRGAKGAVPYIENLPHEAIERFQKQVELVDMMNVTSMDLLVPVIDELLTRDAEPFDGGRPYIVKLEKKVGAPAMGTGPMNLHKDILMDEYLQISRPVIGESVSIHRDVSMSPYGEIVSN